MVDQNNKHIVEFDSEREQLSIHRLLPDGKTVFYTEISFADLSKIKEEKSFSSVCEILGEVLIVDSEAGRKLFDV